MEITAVPFAYNTKAVSEEQFSKHIILYKGYITKTNDITRALAKGDFGEYAADYAYRGLKNGEAYVIDGVILHELYFSNMTKQSQKPGPAAIRIFDEFFGGFDEFCKKFSRCAMSARGWCILSYEQRTKDFRIFLQDTHDLGVVTSACPVLVLDMYEHAYFLDYQTDKQKYIAAFLQSVDWGVVDKRIDKIF